MITKFNTGQEILIPAVIRSAREINGKIIYEVDANTWEGIPEDAIIVDNEVSAKAAYDREMTKLSREIY